jgi:hypothetical protein
VTELRQAALTLAHILQLGFKGGCLGFQSSYRCCGTIPPRHNHILEEVTDSEAACETNDQSEQVHSISPMSMFSVPNGRINQLNQDLIQLPTESLGGSEAELDATTSGG